MAGTVRFLEFIQRAIEGWIWDRVDLGGPATVVKVTSGPTAPTMVDVQPLTRRPIRRADDDAAAFGFEPYPVIPNVPVIFPGGAGGTITWKLAPGDVVYRVVSTWDPRPWFGSGVESDPAWIAFGYAGAFSFAIPCVRPSVAPYPAGTADADALVIDPEIEVRIGKLAIGPEALLALAAKVDQNINAINACFAAIAAAGSGDAVPAAVSGAMPVLTPTACTKAKAE